MDNPTRDQGDELSISALGQQDQANHSVDGQIVETQVELYNKRLELNAKRLGLNGKQLQLNAELLKLYKKQLELDAEQLELNGEHLELTVRTNMNIVLEIMSSASANTSAIPVVDVPADDPTTPTMEQLLALITAPPVANESISPCPPISALRAACPPAARMGKRRALPNKAPESSMAPKRHRVSKQVNNDGTTANSSSTTCHSSSERVMSERLLAAIRPSIFFDLDFALAIYRRTHGYSLMPPGVKLKHFVKRLAKMDGLEHRVPQLETTDSAGLAHLNLPCRCDLEPVALRLDVLQQLGMAKEMRAVVHGPQLCHVLVTMCGMQVDPMTDPILSTAHSDTGPLTSELQWGTYRPNLYLGTRPRLPN
ncbi:hypothetical protein H4R27_005419 [Coemansia aciculifera]|nr:hypothetical protein H4R27_005419 [Coemansia aciculifera]